MRKVSLGIVAVGAAVAVVAVVVRQTAPRSRPNVVLISIDTLRVDHLGCYGYERDTSPFLDSLAKEGVLFTNTFSQSSWTLPSHMSIMTSEYPHVHRVEKAHQRLAESTVTLAKVLKSAGYETAGFVTNIFVSKLFGFAGGFDKYESFLGPKSAPQRKAAHVTDQALQWMRPERDKPFFLFLHYFDPHLDYAPPPPFDTMFDPDYEGQIDGFYETMKPFIKGLNQSPRTLSPRDLEHVIALYDGEIRYTDSQLERLYESLKAAGRLEDTLIIVTSDHGEEHNDHGSMEGHQWTLYDEITCVPLIMRFPRGLHGGQTIRSITESIDIAPTILDWLGLEIPASFQGRSLWPWIPEGETPSEGRLTFSITKRFNVKAAVRDHRHKLVLTANTGVNRWNVPVRAGIELYDLVADPDERENIFESTPELGRSFQRTLNEWLRESSQAPDDAKLADRVRFSPQELERLKSLGYVGIAEDTEP